MPLLAYLLLHRNSPPARESIATALWPESDRVESFANLRRHLHYLHKALPEPANGVPWIVAETRSVSWMDEWMFFNRERLRSLQMANLALLTADARERKAYLQALQYAQLMLALDPWREDALRSVIEIRGLLGDNSGALVEYERFAQRLNDELGVAPSDETAQLYARLRRAGGSASQQTLEPVEETPPLAGRRNELAMLAEEWHRARQGRCRIFLIGGEGGIGKTTLLEALASIAHGEKALVLRGAASPNAPYQAFVDIFRQLGDSTLHEMAGGHQSGSGDERLRFFESIAQVLRRAAERSVLVLLEDLHLAGAASVDLLRYLVARLGDAPVLFAATYREGEVHRSHPLRAMRRQLARGGPLSHLAVTPLDWESARDLIRSRSRRPLSDDVMRRIYEAADGNPLFMIETVHQFAQGGIERVPASIAAIVHARLGSLDAPARAVAEASAVAGRQCTVELAAQVTGLREGEVLRAFDDLVDRHIARECMSNESGEFTFVHDIVRKSVYEQIPQEARRRKHARLGLVLQELYASDLAEYSGELARHFELGGLHAEATNLYASAAESALGVYALEEAQYCAYKVRELSSDRLTQARALFIIDSVARSRGAREERAEALEALERIAPVLSADLQTELCFRLAEVLTTTSDARAHQSLETLRAAVGDDAHLRARYLLVAGEYSHQHGQHEQAVTQLREAQQLFERSGDVQGALACYPAWLAALIAAGGLRPQVIERITQPEDLSDPRTVALTASARASALYNYDPPGGYASAQEMLNAAQVAGDRWLEALALRKLGNHGANMNRLSLADLHLRLSAELTLASGRPYNIAAARVDQMQVANRAAHYTAAYEFSEEAIVNARACGSLDLQVRALAYRCDSDVLAGDFESAIENLRPLLEKAERSGLGGILPGILYLLGMLQVGIEDPHRGIASILRAQQYSSRFRINHSCYPIMLGLAHLCAGDQPKALEYALEVRDKKKRKSHRSFTGRRQTSGRQPSSFISWGCTTTHGPSHSVLTSGIAKCWRQ